MANWTATCFARLAGRRLGTTVGDVLLASVAVLADRFRPGSGMFLVQGLPAGSGHFASTSPATSPRVSGTSVSHLLARCSGWAARHFICVAESAILAGGTLVT